MANEKKMTKVEAFTIAKAVMEQSAHPQAEEVIAKLAKELEQLAKKNSATAGKATAKQIANMGLGEIVVEFFQNHPGEKFTVSELLKQVAGLPEETTTPKLTHILQLESVKAYVDNVKEKGKSLYFAKEIAE